MTKVIYMAEMSGYFLKAGVALASSQPDKLRLTTPIFCRLESNQMH